MQDLNNENTKPTRPNRGPEDETRPTRVQPEPADAESEVTRPVTIQPATPQHDPEPASAQPGLGATQPMHTRPTPPPPPQTTVVSSTPAYPPAEPAVAVAAPGPGGKKAKPRRAKRWPWVLLGILMVFLFAGAGGWMGYQAAVKLRLAKRDEQKVTVATEHFMLGLTAQNNKQYQIAQKQFEYVIQLDPNFPGAADKLREVMIAMAVKETPTLAPTIAQPTMTPTLDTRPQEEIYNQAVEQFKAQDWNSLFGTIDSLRRIDPKYHAVEIDGMLYVALRARGIDKMLHQANLEGGLYDLALAEQFGPLDVDAVGYRTWARQYLNGASFWEVDWKKVMEAFEQIYPYFPNMRDSSGMTAIERYRIAAKSYGDELAAAGDNCGAWDYYDKSLKAVADNALAAKATEVYNLCHPPTATFTATVPVVATTPVPPAATTPPAEGTTPPVVTTTVPPVETTVPPTATTPPAVQVSPSVEGTTPPANP